MMVRHFAAREICRGRDQTCDLLGDGLPEYRQVIADAIHFQFEPLDLQLDMELRQDRCPVIPQDRPRFAQRENLWRRCKRVGVASALASTGATPNRGVAVHQALGIARCRLSFGTFANSTTAGRPAS